MPYDTTLYQEEKELGIRSPSGKRNLTRLTGKHLRVINYHMRGMKNYEIGEIMQVTAAWISGILNDPLTKEAIAKRYVETDQEMFAKATNVIDKTLDSNDEALRLRAAETVWRSRGKFDKRVDDRPTAEDVVQRMLAIAAQQGSATIRVEAGAPTSSPTINGGLE